MKCEQYTSLQALAEDSLQTSSLDTPQWLQSNGNPTPAKSSEREQQMDGFQNCESGKEMSAISTQLNTPEKWIAFMQDSLVRTLALLESKQELVKEPDQVFTEKSCVLLASLDRENYSWKMSPQLKATVLKRYSKTWPSWGMTVDGSAFAHPMSERRITETGGLRYVVPTPTVNMISGGPNHNSPQVVAGKHGLNLSGFVQMWPTPTAHNAKEGGYPAEGTRNTPTLASMAGGKLNPTWVEWLMGFPIGFTDSKDWVTPKSRSKLQSRTNSCKGKRKVDLFGDAI